MIGRCCSSSILVWAAAACVAVRAEGFPPDVPEIAAKMTPRPQHMTLGEGHFDLGGGPWVVGLPPGLEHEACRGVAKTALKRAGVAIRAEEARDNTLVKCRLIPGQA